MDPDENAGDDVCIPPSNNRRKKNLTGGGQIKQIISQLMFFRVYWSKRAMKITI
jgi:hypothetical protein